MNFDQSGNSDSVDKRKSCFPEIRKFIQSIAEVSLMMANISQLTAVLSFGDKNQFFIYLVTLIIVTLVAQSSSVIRTISTYLIALVRRNGCNQNSTSCSNCCTMRNCFTKCLTDLQIDNVFNCFRFIIICANIGITGIGISADDC
ncbi:Hypothetical predicted protein [Mytilus galloprovincialis]|uniref:Uncharacterized protein n=1 Tax=Mytilus galloprovincialis TaxID=29158 RepID=A0A8B6DF65_MYTGA|nr:Hypothetical predicted protein [Mytilus galloprovincialis]